MAIENRADRNKELRVIPVFSQRTMKYIAPASSQQHAHANVHVFRVRFETIKTGCGIGVCPVQHVAAVLGDQAYQHTMYYRDGSISLLKDSPQKVVNRIQTITQPDPQDPQNTITKQMKVFYPIRANDIVACELDLELEEMRIYINGIYRNTVSGLSREYEYHFCLQATVGQKFTVLPSVRTVDELKLVQVTKSQQQQQKVKTADQQANQSDQSEQQEQQKVELVANTLEWQQQQIVNAAVKDVASYSI